MVLAALPTGYFTGFVDKGQAQHEGVFLARKPRFQRFGVLPPLITLLRALQGKFGALAGIFGGWGALVIKVPQSRSDGVRG